MRIKLALSVDVSVAEIVSSFEIVGPVFWRRYSKSIEDILQKFWNSPDGSCCSLMNMFSMLCPETTNVLSNIIMYEIDVSANNYFQI
jgi:hypothetical protein